MTDPVPRSLQIKFWSDRVAAAAAAGKSVRAAVSDAPDWWWADLNRQTAATLVLHLSPGQRVIDACCGTGDLAGLVPDGVEFAGFDLVPEFIEQARQDHPGCCFFVADLFAGLAVIQGQLPAGPWDWVISRGLPDEVLVPLLEPLLFRLAPRVLSISFADPKVHNVWKESAP